MLQLMLPEPRFALQELSTILAIPFLTLCTMESLHVPLQGTLGQIFVAHFTLNLFWFFRGKFFILDTYLIFVAFFTFAHFEAKQILHSKVRKFATQTASRQNTVNCTNCKQFVMSCVKSHTVCKITHCTMRLSIELENFQVLKSNGLVFAQFWSKSVNFSFDWGSQKDKKAKRPSRVTIKLFNSFQS